MMIRQFASGCIFISFLLVNQFALSQETNEVIHEGRDCNCPGIRKGLYRNFLELRDGKPFKQADFTAEQTYSNKSKTKPRAHYKIIFPDKSQNIPDPEKTLYALSDGENLYINTFSAGQKKGFVKACCFGQFAYFHEINPNPDDYYVASGAAGIGGAVGAQIVTDYARAGDKGSLPRQMIFILDFETGFVSPLNSFKMEKILENNSELLKAYMAEPRRTNMEVMHFYLDRFLAGRN